MDQFDRLAEAAPPAALRAAGRDPVVLAGRLDQLRAFPDVVRDGLLDVDVLAGLHGPDGGQRVPVVRGGDGDRVDVLVVEDAAHVGLDLRPLAGLLKDSRGGGFRAPAVGIDQRGDLDVGDGQNLLDMGGAPGAHANDGEAYAIVRAGPGLGSGR